MKHRPIGISAGIAAAVLLLSACSSSGGGQTPGGGGAGGELQILVSSSAGSDKGFEAVNSAFEKANPDIKVKFSTVPNENYSASQSTRLSAGNVDILTIDGGHPLSLPEYVQSDALTNDQLAAMSGNYLDLSDQGFMADVYPDALKQMESDGKHFAYPLGLSYHGGVYYNKSVFEKYGLAVPTTWSEFVAVCQTLQDNGVAPIGIGGKDSWPAGLAMLAAVQHIYPSQADKQELDEALWKGEVKLTDPKPLSVLERVKTIYDFTEKNFPGIGYSEIPAQLISGEVAMTPDGTWNAPTIAGADPSFEFGYFPLPTSDTAADNALLAGKVDLSVAVASNAPNKAAALKYLDFISQPENLSIFLESAGFAPAVPGVEQSEFLDSIEQYTKTFSPAWDQVFHANPNAGANATFPFNYTGLAPMGEFGSADAAAEAAQKDWSAGLQ